ncbi:hypothetical protein SNEBB_003647 [Seison nebaliae]|nr:hypothetical protein SNEBB_003647 [Seison nebaliae]
MMINKRINSLLFSDLGLFKLRPTNHFYHMVNWMNSFHIFDTNFSLEYLRGIVNNEKNYVTYKNMEIFKLPFINHMCYGFKKNVFQKLFDWVKDLYVTYDRTFFDVEQQDEAFNKHRARFLVTILFNNLWEAFMSTFSSRKHPPTNSNGSSVHYDNFYTYIPSSNNYNPNKKRKAKLTFIHFQSLANIILSKRNFGIFDFEFKKLLDQLKMQKKNRLRNTILILVGDGNHYDERVDTILHGKKKKNPLLAIGLGETVRRNFPNLEKQLKLNRNKRVSTIDIYRTIIELVDELKETGNKRKDFTEKWIKYYHQLYHMNGFEGDNSLIKQSLKCFNNSVSLFSSFSGNRTCDDICSKSIIHSHSCSYHEGTMKMLFDSSASDVPFDSSQYRWDTKLSVENIDIMDELNIYSIHQSHEKFGWKFIKNILHFSNKLSMFLEEVLEQYITDDDTRAFCKNLKIVSLIHVQYLRKHNNYLLIDVDLEPSPRLLRLVLKSNFRNSIDILKTNTFDDVTLVNIMNGGRTLPDHSWCLKSYDMFQRDLCYCE